MLMEELHLNDGERHRCTVAMSKYHPDKKTRRLHHGNNLYILITSKAKAVPKSTLLNND